MALPSFFKRKDSKPAAPQPVDPLGDDSGPVQAARIRARRRLIGAVVLLAIGVVGFPMLFETQPRPLPNDIPIEVPRRDGAAPRPAALPRVSPAVTELPVVAEAPAVAPAPSAAIAPVSEPEPPEPKGAVVAPPAAAPGKVDPPKPEPATPAPAKVEATKPVEVRVADAKKVESDRARALLEGRGENASAPATAAIAASEAKSGRFVVQVGAYTDADTLREVRAKVEKLGLKTYTQSVETDAGKRTRVRVGPYATRQEAESASGRLKGAGLPGNVLVL